MIEIKNIQGEVIATLDCDDLSRADLTDLDLSNADLRGADLFNATIVRTNLKGADLRGADLRCAYVAWVDFREAITDRHTELPPVNIGRDACHI